MTLSSNFALKRGGGRNNEGGVTTREYGTAWTASVSVSGCLNSNIHECVHIGMWLLC